MAFKLRYRRVKRALPYHWDVFVPEGGYPPPIPSPLPWSFEYTGIIPSPPMSGNVHFMVSLARRHLAPGPKQQYLLQSIVNGFSTHGRWLQVTPGLRRLAANRISPGMPGADAVDAQINRILQRQQGFITHAPIPGTQNFILNVDDSKTNADGSIKYRPVSSCSYPYNDSRDRTSWTARSDTTVFSEVLLLAMAAGLQQGPSVAFACDLAKSFEWINRRRDEVNTNCLVWHRGGRVIYFYSFVFLFGESGTPRIAHDFFELLSREMRRRLRLAFPFPTFVVRNCDDFLGIVPIDHADECTEAFNIATSVFPDAGVPIQTTKSVVSSPTVDWHGFQLDFTRQTISYGSDKCSRLLKSLVQFMDHPPMFTRGRCFVGHLEHLCCADLWLSVHVPAIRACVFAAETTNAPITWSTEARSDLERFHRRLTNTDYAPTARFADHFIVPDPDMVTVFSDASGKDTLGVGGYTPTVYSCAKWSDLPSWLLDPRHYSTGAIELVGLLLMAIICPPHATVCWVTDSEAADGAWSKLRSPAPLCNAILKLIQGVLAHKRTLVHSRHVPREQNVLADILSHCDHKTYWEQRPRSDLQVYSHAVTTLESELSTLTPLFG